MAKPGDVVAFRGGLHGIEPPRNLGILLDRWRRKGVAWVRLATVDGVKEVKAEHLSGRAFRDRYAGDLRDTEAVLARLRDLVARHAEGGLAEEVEDDLGALEERLWEATCDADRDAWTEEELATALYGAPSPQQMRDVRAVLTRCRRAGTGRFETVAGRGDTWRPWTRDEVQHMRSAWEALQALRGKLVTVEETDEGRVLRRVALEDAGLDASDEETLIWVRDAMVQFIEHDGVPDGGAPVAGIGGLGVVKAFGMDLHRSLGFLAADWIRSTPTSRSSDYVHFLLETGLWSPDDAVQSLMRRHVNQEPYFEHVPDRAAEEAAEALPRPEEEPDTPDRRDLRHLECYTIDPPDAKDFDDAVALEPGPDGTQRLWVHIADVSHYVRPGSRLDDHAKKRATSVYLPGRVLPMLPHRIADDLCSLRDDGDRLAVSVALDVDPDGQVKKTSFCTSRIRVRANLSYGDALARAEAGIRPFADLLDLAARMRRHRRGLALETGELKVILEDTGFHALEKRADAATRMIETFMVAANEAVARHLSDHDVPLLYRCHPLPDAEKAVRFGHQLEAMGFDLPFTLPEPARKAAEPRRDTLLDRLRSGGGRLELFGGGMDLLGPDGEDGDPEGMGSRDSGETAAAQGFAALDPETQEAWLRPFRDVVDALADHPDQDRAEVAALKLLACMGRAFYTPDNEGHFGLGSNHYCHFTSPIRRYPDLVVHRNLKWLLRQGQAGSGPDPHPPHDAASIGTLSDHCSNQERAAESLERRVKNACMVLASLADGKGAVSGARVIGITPANLFVLLDSGIDARIPQRDLPGGPYRVDEWESMLYLSDLEDPQRFAAMEGSAWTDWLDPESGERRRVRCRLADRLQVRLAGRDVAQGRTGAVLEKW